MVNPVETSEENVEKILTQVLKNTGLKFKKINEKTFVILSKDERSKTGATAQAVDMNISEEQLKGAVNVVAPLDVITGKVIGADGGPVFGITITVKGTRRGTAT